MNKIYVIATPIGNLQDITLRAIDTLSKVNVIFCEDTKHSKILLNKYNIKNAKLISLNKFNESSRINLILKSLNEGDVAIISDAGTPSISDPGQYIIKKLRSENCEIVPLPGANSIVTALSVSGEIFDSFSFFGFLPKTRESIINTIYENVNTDLSIYFESPKRIKKTLEIFKNDLKDFSFLIAREITKNFEDIRKVRASEILDDNIKGEIVLIINNKNLDKIDQAKYLIGKYKGFFLNNKELMLFLNKSFLVKKRVFYDIINDM